MIRRAIVAGATLAATLLLAAAPAAAHPLGNATVNRATAITIGPEAVGIVYVVDMAEIPAYAAILDLDLDANGARSTDERARWAMTACDDAQASLALSVDGVPVGIHAAQAPGLTFPPGVGGLETLRLVCTFSGALPADGGEHALTVTDGTGDERSGWSEVTIGSEAGVTVAESDVPSVSPSALLTAYPEDLLQAPIDIASGSATYRAAPSSAPRAAAAGADTAASNASTGGPTDALVDLLDGGAAPWSWLLAVAVAAGLGAAHAVSPGHGKALIAAYVIGSRGSLRRAAGLGLTVAASHTIGVFALGLIILSATELLVPDQVVAWLSVASGMLVVGVGASVARRAWRARRTARHRTHGHDHPHPHGHDHPHPHGHDHPHPHGHEHDAQPPAAREFLTLGLIGGMVPSTSALLVLLVAVATGRLVEGLILIVAFGAGMAMVLGGLAAVTALARNGLAGAASGPGGPAARRLAGAAPLASAVVIIAVGVATTVGALGSL
jgi:nickel/cobalt transporter (NicO) family protein